MRPQGLKKGDKIESGKNVEIKIGNCLELKDIPPGTSIHNVELIPGNGGKLQDLRVHQLRFQVLTEITLY